MSAKEDKVERLDTCYRTALSLDRQIDGETQAERQIDRETQAERQIDGETQVERQIVVETNGQESLYPLQRRWQLKGKRSVFMEWVIRRRIFPRTDQLNF